MSPTQNALTLPEFDSLLSPCITPHEPCAVAVSGGADSMAMCLLAQEWAEANNTTIIALTVDHKLRPESTAEAQTLHNRLHARGIAHHILTWHHDGIQGNLQEAARNARYTLMTDWCHQNDITQVLIAHHQEDQAETFLLRLARGSGVDGLSAMAPVSMKNGIRILRPLLDIPKARLVATLRAAKQEWIEDSSNSNAAFDRIKFRQAQAMLSDLGLTPERLADTAKTMARAKKALESATKNLCAQCVTKESANTYMLLDTSPLIQAEEDIALRVLANVIREIGTPQNPPRIHELERLYQHIKSGGAGCTLGNCRFVPDQRKNKFGQWRVEKEEKSRAAS